MATAVVFPKIFHRQNIHQETRPCIWRPAPGIIITTITIFIIVTVIVGNSSSRIFSAALDTLSPSSRHTATPQSLVRSW